MKLRDEHLRSYIDDHRTIGLLDYLTWRKNDVAAAWIGAHEPATRSDDVELVALAKFSRDHYLFYRALVERFLEPESCVLDVGCGSGHRTAMLARYANQVVGVDSNMASIAIGGDLNNRHNIKWYRMEFMEWAQRHGDIFFDFVFCVEVIEHIALDRQKDFMAALLEQVASGGLLLMTTPRDKFPVREIPHIGLWDDDIAQARAGDLAATIKYFNVRQLIGGNTNPWSPIKTASHYVLVATP